MDLAPSVVVTVAGPDRPGIGAALWRALATVGLSVTDVEQITVRGQLLLCAEIAAPGPEDLETIRAALQASPLSEAGELSVSAHRYVDPLPQFGTARQVVTVLAPQLGAVQLASLFEVIARHGATVERIQRLANYPVDSYELLVATADAAALQADLGAEANAVGVDVAVQPVGLHRRAKHLIVLDADSTFLQVEVIDLLAARAGCADQVAAITERAMAGELDFEASLRERVALLRGLPETVLAEVAAQAPLNPGARTLVRTLQRLGYVAAIVSGGFLQVLEPITTPLGIDLVAANTLGVRDGLLTGEVVGPVVDRAGKAEALRRFAAQVGVPLSQTVAVGDGANDLDMLAAAGLGIAYNAKPVVAHAADAALNVPYLDAVLFVLGISRREIEAADAESA